jgi:hypothetical protein
MILIVSIERRDEAHNHKVASGANLYLYTDSLINEALDAMLDITELF